MHGAVFTRSSQEEPLVVHDSNRVYWVLMLIERGDKKTLWPQVRKLFLRIGSKVTLLLIGNDEAFLLIPRIKVCQQRWLGLLSSKRNLTVDAESLSHARGAVLEFRELVQSICLLNKWHLVESFEDFLSLRSDEGSWV